MEQINLNLAPSNEWFEFGNRSEAVHAKDLSAVISKQPQAFRMLGSSAKQSSLQPDQRQSNHRLAQITYTNVAEIKKSDHLSTHTSLFGQTRIEHFQSYYRQKLMSSKVLFRNSKLRQLDMLDNLLLIPQKTHNNLRTDESMRLFSIFSKEGTSLFKVIEGNTIIVRF